MNSFTDTCLAIAPHATIASPRFEPEVGAVLIALNEIGVAIDQRIIHAVETTSQNFPALGIGEAI
jgi:hypothetical protein